MMPENSIKTNLPKRDSSTCNLTPMLHITSNSLLEKINISGLRKRDLRSKDGKGSVNLDLGQDDV